MYRGHQQAGVLSVEVDRQEALLPLEALVDLKEPSLYHFECLFAILYFVLHRLSISHATRKVLRGRCWRRLIVQLHLEEELHIQIPRLHLNFSPEFHNITQHDYLISIPHEKGLAHEAVGLILNIWLHQPMKRHLRCLQIAQDDFGISAFVEVRICKVLLVLHLMEDLKLHEVNSLLDQVDVSELLQVKNELGDSTKRHEF